MLKLNHIVSEKIWGYELWKASTHPNGCQKELLDFAGGDYPLLVKVIQADDVLSVQVKAIAYPSHTALPSKSGPIRFLQFLNLGLFLSVISAAEKS